MSHKANEQLTNTIVSTLSYDKNLIAMQVSMNDLTAIYPYYQDGKEVFVKVRFDKDGKKWIKPFYFDGNKYRLGEPKLKPKPIYQPMPLTDTVYIVEGEKCVHSLIDLGLCAVTTGGANTIGVCDLTPLLGHKCVLWRDNDDGGSKWQDELSQALNRLNIAFDVIDVAGVQMPDGEPMADKDDCYDFIQAHYADGQDDGGIVDLIKQLPRLEVGDNQADDVNDGIDVALVMQELKAKKALLEQAINELASLDELELQLCLKDVSRKFGIAQAKIMQYVADVKRGAVVCDVAPFDTPVDGKALYQDLYALVDNHMVMDDELKVAFVLWVILSYLLDIANHAPLAWITAPEKQCGKSTLLSLFERVVNKPMSGASITPAVLFRVVEKYKPTLLLDEIDMTLKDNTELLGIINAGHSRHAPFVWRYDNDDKCEKAFNVFGAKVFCGIGKMNGTFMSRAIKFELRRKHKDDKAIGRINEQQLPRQLTDKLRAKIKRWSMDNKPAIAKVTINPINNGINDRDFDNWYTMLQIASVLGVYDVAVKACLSICQVEREPSLNEQLLMDIRDILGNRERISTTEILEKLTDNSELQWQTYNRGQPLSQYQLAKKLTQFGVKSKNARAGQAVIKHYFGNELRAVFDRYLPPPTQDDDNPFVESP